MTVTNLTPPVISGTARQGQWLTTTDGTWTSTDPLTYTYEWLRCDAAGANCVVIAGQTQNDYLLTLADVGSRIRSRVTATEGAPAPPSSAELTWSPPSLTSPTTRTLTNSARSVPVGANGDLEIVCGQVLTGAIGEINTYNDVVAIEGEFNSTQSASSSGHIVPRKITGTFHLEGWKFRTNLAGDFCTSRQRAKYIQIQACDIAVTDALTSYHSDGFQTQITQIDELRIDRCTFYTDYQGVTLINELPIASSPDASYVTRTIIKRTVFREGANDFGMTFFLSKPPKAGCAPLGQIDLFDVWMEDGMICYPHTDFNQWDGSSGTGHRFGAFRINKLHSNGNTYPFWKFSTSSDTVPSGRPGAGNPASDCNVRGDGGVWIFTAGGNPPAGLDLGAPGDAGMGYVSPGYV